MRGSQLAGVSELPPMSTNCKSFAPRPGCQLVCTSDEGINNHWVVPYVYVTALPSFSASTPENCPSTLTARKGKGKVLNMKFYEVDLF